MNENNELINHEVVIDKYLTATLSIPKKLTSLELKALFMKANKLFNLSEVEIADSNTTNVRGVRGKYKRHIFSPEIIEEIKMLYKKYINERFKHRYSAMDINKKFNTDYASVVIEKKVAWLKKHGELE